MPAVRRFAIDEPSALFRLGSGAIVFYANDTMQHQLVRVTNRDHFMLGLFRVWRLKGRPFMAVVMRNVEPGHYLAEWPFGRVSLDVLVLPGRVTRVDWRAIDYHARHYDQMVLPEPTIAPIEAEAEPIVIAA